MLHRSCQQCVLRHIVNGKLRGQGPGLPRSFALGPLGNAAKIARLVRVRSSHERSTFNVVDSAVSPEPPSSRRRLDVPLNHTALNSCSSGASPALGRPYIFLIGLRISRLASPDAITAMASKGVYLLGGPSKGTQFRPLSVSRSMAIHRLAVIDWRSPPARHSQAPLPARWSPRDLARHPGPVQARRAQGGHIDWVLRGLCARTFRQRSQSGLSFAAHPVSQTSAPTGLPAESTLSATCESTRLLGLQEVFITFATPFSRVRRSKSTSSTQTSCVPSLSPS